MSTNLHADHDSASDKFRIIPWGTDQTFTRKGSRMSCLQRKRCTSDPACSVVFDRITSEVREKLISARDELNRVHSLAMQTAGTDISGSVRDIINNL